MGFPGEREQDFQESFTFLKEISFYDLHVFKFSRRKGTKADEMKEQIPDSIKTARSKEVLALALEDSKKFREKFLGKESSILIEEIREIDGKYYYTGFNKEYIRYILPVQDELLAELEENQEKKDERLAQLGKEAIGRIRGVKGLELMGEMILAEWEEHDVKIKTCFPPV